MRALFSRHPLVILAGLFVAAYVGVFAMFTTEGHPKTVLSGVDAAAIHIDLHLLNVDLQRDMAFFTLQPDVRSSDIAIQGRLKSDIVVEVDLGSTVISHTFKKGELAVPWSFNAPLEYGDTLEYPFDKHGGDLLVKVKCDAMPSTLANIDLDKVMHGFAASATGAPTADNNQVALHYQIGRSSAVIFLALMAMTSLTMVLFSAVNVAKQVAMHGRKVEFGMLVWIAALLFVIPAVRNGLPGSPPAGALVDIALFFWLHIIGVGSLLVVVSKWKSQT